MKTYPVHVTLSEAVLWVKLARAYRKQVAKRRAGYERDQLLYGVDAFIAKLEAPPAE